MQADHQSRRLDEALARLRDGAPRWARASLPDIPARDITTDLPLDKTVPLTLELKRAERIELRCKDGSAVATLVVGSP